MGAAQAAPNLAGTRGRFRLLLAGTVDTDHPVTSEGHGVVKALKALGKLPLPQAA